MSNGWWIAIGCGGYVLVAVIVYVVLVGFFDMDSEEVSFPITLWPFVGLVMGPIFTAHWLAKKVKAARLLREERHRSSAAERAARECEAAAEAASKPPFR